MCCFLLIALYRSAQNPIVVTKANIRLHAGLERDGSVVLFIVACEHYYGRVRQGGPKVSNALGNNGGFARWIKEHGFWPSLLRRSQSLSQAARAADNGQVVLIVFVTSAGGPRSPIIAGFTPCAAGGSGQPGAIAPPVRGRRGQTGRQGCAYDPIANGAAGYKPCSLRYGLSQGGGSAIPA